MTYQSYTIITRRVDGTLGGDTVTSETPNKDYREIYRHGQAYEIIATIPGPEPYTELAQTHMLIGTLEYRANDALDFHTVSYHQIKNALRDAYYRGFDAGREPRETRQHDCPFCGKQWREYCDDADYPNYCPNCGEELRDPNMKGGEPMKQQVLDALNAIQNGEDARAYHDELETVIEVIINTDESDVEAAREAIKDN